ncbi:MAG: 50S ribosomal protein L15 [Chlamydiia bacterium]|nr:50S ribosomal protein L15 [Chlamydiia bacterium]
MLELNKLERSSNIKSKMKRVGRGVGSGKGKTCGRGTKGAKARSGYKRRLGNEGGQCPVFRKTPIRGFTRGAFKKETYSINLGMISEKFNDGDVVSLETLKEKSLISKKSSAKIRILGHGDLTVKVNFEAHHFTKSAEEKILKAECKVVRV